VTSLGLGSKQIDADELRKPRPYTCKWSARTECDTEVLGRVPGHEDIGIPVHHLCRGEV
jgi:hypothetical protein